MKIKKLIVFMVLLFFGCNSKNNVIPRMSIPGYDTKLIFQDNFNTSLENWKKEGIGEIDLTAKGEALLHLGAESKGLALWALKNFNDDFQLEFNLTIPSQKGFFIIILCAHGLQGEDILDDHPERSGALEDYSKGNIRSYHISSHCYTAEGDHIPGSKIRKNPGHLLLAKSQVDPCTGERTYYIDVEKVGNRIRYYVDDMLILDFKDRGGFGPIYSEGKIGFWIGGEPEEFSVILDNVRVFRLKAQ